ncbi:WD40-repeat-containing domain protein [Cyathus striatus]|nr:WD40-repeat-containing domain protein [Cyathus striatus]
MHLKPTPSPLHYSQPDSLISQSTLTYPPRHSSSPDPGLGASQTLYLPIESPPTPAPSPGPSSIPLTLSSSFPVLPPLSAPTLRRQFLTSLLHQCTPSELLFLSSTIAPLLKKDVLKALPIELGLYILSFVDEPRTLMRASMVSRYWRHLVCDDWVWKGMCERWEFGVENVGGDQRARGRRRVVHEGPRDDLGDEGEWRTFSFLRHFKTSYQIMQNWRTSSNLLRTHTLGDSSVVTSLALDSEWVVVGLASSHINVFSARTGVLARTLVGHELGVWGVCLISREESQRSSETFSSRGWGQPHALVVSGGCDKVLLNVSILSPGTHPLYDVSGFANRPVAVSGSRDCTLRVWDVQRGRCLRSVRCLDVCGNVAVSGSYDTTCRVWNIDTGECMHVLRGHFHQIYSVVFDGTRIASGGLDTTVRVWDAASGQCLALLQGHTALVCQLQLLPSSPSSSLPPLLATGGSDGRVITFALDTYSIQHRIAAHDSSVSSLQFDSRFLVTGGNDGRVRLYDVKEGNYAAYWKDVLAVMCKRGGRTVMEIWSMKPRER